MADIAIYGPAGGIVRVEGDGSITVAPAPGSQGLNFFSTSGAGPWAAQQTVTGSRGANAALASLITALANLGLIVDTTS